jgi:14-3-3 protein epsilon
MLAFMRHELDRINPPPLPPQCWPDLETRSLLAIALKSRVAKNRQALHTLQASVPPIARAQSTQHSETRMLTVAARLLNTCEDAIKLIRARLLPIPVDLQLPYSIESHVFWQKLMADNLRWMIELELNPFTSEFFARKFPKSSPDYEAYSITAAQACYDAALEESKLLASTSPVRLGLALNASVFYHDVMKAPDSACALAKGAFDAAVTLLSQRDELESVLGTDSSTLKATDPMLRDVKFVMIALRDKFTGWTTEADVDEGSPALIIFKAWMNCAVFIYSVYLFFFCVQPTAMPKRKHTSPSTLYDVRFTS